MTKSAGTGQQQRRPTILSRMASVLSFANLALLGKKRTRAETKPEGRADPAAAPISAKKRTPAASSLRKPAPQGSRDAEAEGRRLERARCASIILSGPGQRNPELAVHMAMETDITVQEALAVLEATPPSRRGAVHADRAAGNPQFAAVPVPSSPPSKAAAARMDQAIAQALPPTAHTKARP